VVGVPNLVKLAKEVLREINLTGEDETTNFK
jgi:hypothetical protein